MFVRYFKNIYIGVHTQPRNAQSRKAREMIFASSTAKNTSRDSQFLRASLANGVRASMDSMVSL